jgi:hypothetical protein
VSTPNDSSAESNASPSAATAAANSRSRAKAANPSLRSASALSFSTIARARDTRSDRHLPCRRWSYAAVAASTGRRSLMGRGQSKAGFSTLRRSNSRTVASGVQRRSRSARKSCAFGDSKRGPSFVGLARRRRPMPELRMPPRGYEDWRGGRDSHGLAESRRRPAR